MPDNQRTVSRHRIPLLALGFSVLVFALAGASDKGFNPPRATHAKTYPLHETHDDENVSIAIEPYTSPDKAAIFKVKYREYGLLVVRMIISNDGDKPLMLDDLIVECVTARRVKLQPATKDDIYRRLARPEKAVSKPTVRLPIPGTGKRPTSISNEALQEIDSAMFVTVPVSPHSTNSGFLFFDVMDVENPEAGAHVYVSGVRAGTKELFYFDIPLEKLQDSAPAK
jgi:hypothetical protein